MVVLAFAVVLSSFISYIAVSYQKVVILPPVVDKRIYISGNDASDSYFKLYAKYIANLLANYTPGTFRDQKTDLLALCDPSFLPTLEKHALEIESAVMKLHITSSFFPRKVIIDRKQNLLKITGDRCQTAHSKEISKVTMTYIVKYSMQKGRLYINDIKEKK